MRDSWWKCRPEAPSSTWGRLETVGGAQGKGQKESGGGGSVDKGTGTDSQILRRDTNEALLCCMPLLALPFHFYRSCVVLMASARFPSHD